MNQPNVSPPPHFSFIKSYNHHKSILYVLLNFLFFFFQLAAFQKKKTKKKRKSDTGVEESDSSPQRCPSQAPSPECGSPAGASAACPPVQPSEDADPPSDQQISEEMTEPSSVHYLNDVSIAFPL